MPDAHKSTRRVDWPLLLVLVGFGGVCFATGGIVERQLRGCGMAPAGWRPQDIAASPGFGGNGCAFIKPDGTVDEAKTAKMCRWGALRLKVEP